MGVHLRTSGKMFEFTVTHETESKVVRSPDRPFGNSIFI